MIVQNGAIIKTVTVSQFSVNAWNMLAIAVDSFSKLAVGCQANKYYGDCDSNGNVQFTYVYMLYWVRSERYI